MRGILFDLWNTLAYTDHAPHPMEALQSAFGLADLRVIEKTIMTRRLPGISTALELLERETGHTLPSKRELVLMWGAANNANRLYPDTLPAVAALRRTASGARVYRLGILSNTQSFDLDFLTRSGLDMMMDAICLSCDIGMLKPDPEIYTWAASRLGVAVEEVLMVGDRCREDVEGASGAGLQAILLDRGAPAGPERAIPTVRSLSHLPELLQRSARPPSRA